MVLSNKKYRDVLRVVSHFVEGEERTDACVNAISEILKNELEQYNRGLAKLNENNRVRRERKRQEDLQKRVREYEERKAVDPAMAGPPPSVVDL
eukprot:jgi/Tetstr1/447298/TSEL_034735.t1